MFGDATPPTKGTSAREKLDSLFGGPSGLADRKADARSKLDALFRKPGKPGKSGEPESADPEE